MSERDILIRTIIGEAANEGPEGWAAVAHVVRNRAMDSRWPNSIADVSLQNKQFSAWNEGAGGNDLVNKYGPGDSVYDRIGAVVDRVLAGQVPDMTGGATHYYSPRGMDALVDEGSQANRIPKWLRDETQKRGGGTVTIGGHIFTGRAEGTPDNIVASTNNTTLSGGGGDTTLMGQQAGDQMPTDPAAARRIYDAYIAGKMTPEERQSYEAAVRSGRMSVPNGAELLKPVEAEVIGGDSATKIYDAFLNGRMTADEEASYIEAVRGGRVEAPAPADQLALSRQDAANPLIPAAADVPLGTQPESDPLGLTKQFAGESGGDLAMSAAASLTGNGPSPSGIENPVGRTAADVGLAVLGGVGAAGGALAGAGGDALASLGVSPNTAKRFSRDFAAIPEYLAGSPMAMASAPMRAARRADDLPALDTPADKATPLAADHTRPIVRPEPVAPLSESGAENLAPIIGDAARNNKGARERLADMADIDADAMAAGERAGFDLPGDVYANNPQIQQAIASVRSVRNSDAANEWGEALGSAVTRAGEIMSDEGAVSLGATSEGVRESLTTSITSLRSDAGQVYDKIAAAVPNTTRMQASESLTYLRSIAEEVGGVENMRPALRALLSKLEGDSGVTYGLMRQEKDDIGSAAFRQASIYADSDKRTLTGLYDALREDQMNFVRAEVGEDAAKELAQARRNIHDHDADLRHPNPHYRTIRLGQGTRRASDWPFGIRVL